MVEDNVSSMIDACSEILHRALPKLVDPENNIIDICDAIYVVLKDVYAEWMEQV